MRRLRPWIRRLRTATAPLARLVPMIFWVALAGCSRDCDCQTQASSADVAATRMEQLSNESPDPPAANQIVLAMNSSVANIAVEENAFQPSSVPAAEEETSNGRGKIVGGEDAPPGSYPWIVALGFRIDNGPVQVRCGGTLIRHDWIVSAAHCKLRQGHIAIAGRHDLSQADGQQLRIAEVFVHPNYDPETKKESDLVLARLERSSGIEPIAIVAATDEDPAPGERLRVAGWGKLSDDDPAKPDVLQHVNVRSSDHEVCKRTYAKVRRTVSDTMLCAAERGKDACSGDSGGPLVAVNPFRNTSKLTGIVSWGLENKCAREGYPGVYVKLSKFRTWIDQCIADSTRTACI